MAVQNDIMEAAGPYDRAKALSAFKFGDVTFYWITRACAISVLLSSERRMEAAGPYDRARALSAFKLGDVTFYWLTRACAISVLLILGGIIVSLIVGAWPAIREYGFSFLFTSRWAPSADPPVLGALGPIYGTLITSVIAMMIAIPVGIGIAMFLTEICPHLAAPPDRASRSNCSPAFPRSSTACGASSCWARSWPIRSSRS